MSSDMAKRLLVGTVLALAACGGGAEEGPDDFRFPPPTPSATPSPSATPTPMPTPTPEPSPSPTPSALPRDVFRVEGNVGAPIRRSARPGQRNLIGPRTVTDVLALDPSSQRFERRLAEVASDGSFQLDLAPDRLWLLTFLDRNQVGEAMLVSVFRSDTLDTLVATASGTLSLGDVSVTSSTATTAVAHDALLARLGLDPALAVELGAVDDVCLRYVNPDIDGNGVIDALEPAHRFMLDFHVHMEASDGARRYTVADTLDQFYDFSALAIRHTGTGVYVTYEAAFSSADARSSGSVTFDQDAYLFTSAGSADKLASSPITGGDLIVGNAGPTSFGVYARPNAELPQGTYAFGLGADTLRFAPVRTRTATAIAAADGFVLPMVRFDLVDPTCTGACAIASVSYRWMRHHAGTWREATVDELRVFAAGNGGYLSIVRGGSSSGQRIGISIPPTSSSGTLAWDASSAWLEGLDAAAMAATTTDQLCHVGLSVDDMLGLRYFVGMDDAPGSCR